MHLKELALKCHVITDGRDTAFLSGSAYDPNDFYFDQTLATCWAAASWSDDIEWLYDSFINGETYLYPQLIVKDNHIIVSHLKDSRKG